jgi:hypothetical protein
MFRPLSGAIPLPSPTMLNLLLNETQSSYEAGRYC